jgi:hypothetical protein
VGDMEAMVQDMDIGVFLFYKVQETFHSSSNNLKQTSFTYIFSYS